MNAHTAKDHTGYYMTLLAEHAPVAIDVIADVLRESVFPPEEIERERGVILQEIAEAHDDPIDLGLRVVSINYGGRTYPVSATTESADVTRVKNGGASKDPQKVIGGAVAGAILGRIIGGNAKGTIIGAAAGTAAGAGVAAATARYEGCLNEGASIHARLNDGVQVRLARAGSTSTDPGI